MTIETTRYYERGGVDDIVRHIMVNDEARAARAIIIIVIIIVNTIIAAARVRSQRRHAQREFS